MIQSFDNLEEIKSKSKVIYKNGKMLQLLINDILDYSQIKKGNLRIEAAPVSLNSIIEDVIELFEFQIN